MRHFTTLAGMVATLTTLGLTGCGISTTPTPGFVSKIDAS